MDKRISNTKIVNGRFSSVTYSQVKEGSTVPPPHTPVWAVAEKFRVAVGDSSRIQCDEEDVLDLADDEESPWELEPFDDELEH